MSLLSNKIDRNNIDSIEYQSLVDWLNDKATILVELDEWQLKLWILKLEYPNDTIINSKRYEKFIRQTSNATLSYFLCS